VPSSEEPLEVYVDRSLGQVIVPEALSALGLVVHTEASVFGRVPEGVPDPTWLDRAGREGWIVFTKDTRIRYRMVELTALAGEGVRAFVLSGGNLSGREQADRFVRNMNRIRQACRRQGPFIYAVQADRIVRIFP
jgi:predicted nuclease of predicted toxin-antitoxin system